MTRLAAIVAVVVLAGVVGCSEQNAPVRGLQERVITDATPDEALAHGAVILKREFGRLRTDAGSRRIVTEPVEFTTERESGTARDLYRGRSSMRRTGTFEVGRRGDQTVARLRIDVERQDTARQQAVQPSANRLSDTPGEETPIERDAATTTEQNQVWTRVRRDTRMERALLEELQDWFARQTAKPEAAPLAPSTTQPRSRN